jgi:hypothetical protein
VGGLTKNVKKLRFLIKKQHVFHCDAPIFCHMEIVPLAQQNQQKCVIFIKKQRFPLTF